MVMSSQPFPLAYGTIKQGKLVAHGELLTYDLDLAYGVSENNFELQTSQILPVNTFIWIDGSSAGGVIDSVGYSADSRLRTYKGRTWFGLLGDKIVEPPAGKDYLTISGTGFEMLSQLISIVGLASSQPNGLFTVVHGSGDRQLPKYQLARYISLWEAVNAMYARYGLKIQVVCNKSRLEISLTVPRTVQVDERAAVISLDSGGVSPTHLIGLGSGQLAARQICHRYWVNGKITTSPPAGGWQDITRTYDINDKRGDDLVKATEQKLRELQTQGTGEIEFLGDANSLEPWDILSAHDYEHALYLSTFVSKKIIKVSGLQAQTTVELGDTQASSSNSSSSGGSASQSASVSQYREDCVQFMEGFTDYSKHTRAARIGNAVFLQIAVTGNFTAGQSVKVAQAIPELVSGFSGADALLVTNINAGAGGNSWIGYGGDIRFTAANSGTQSLQAFYFYETIN